MKFGNILKNLRNENKITQKELASILDLQRSSISSYETNLKEPSFDTLIKIADYFNVNIDYLLGRSNFKNDYDQFILLLDSDKELSTFILGFIQNEDLQTLSKKLIILNKDQIKKLNAILDILINNK